MRSVLANPTSLEIRGEFHTGPDEGGLDNVVLRTAIANASAPAVATMNPDAATIRVRRP